MSSSEVIGLLPKYTTTGIGQSSLPDTSIGYTAMCRLWIPSKIMNQNVGKSLFLQEIPVIPVFIHFQARHFPSIPSKVVYHRVGKYLPPILIHPQ